MRRQKSREIETPTGRGKVFSGDTEVATVHYFIRITQAIIVSDGEELPGRQQISGKINVVDGDRNIEIGKHLSLKLSDGRTWQFWAKSGNPISASYQCVNVSGKGMTKP
jgi:hypothetical protein